jgi:hypothetical protein
MKTKRVYRKKGGSDKAAKTIQKRMRGILTRKKKELDTRRKKLAIGIRPVEKINADLKKALRIVKLTKSNSPANKRWTAKIKLLEQKQKNYTTFQKEHIVKLKKLEGEGKELDRELKRLRTVDAAQLCELVRRERNKKKLVVIEQSPPGSPRALELILKHKRSNNPISIKEANTLKYLAAITASEENLKKYPVKQVEHIKVAQKKEREKKRALKVTKSDQEKLVVIDKWKKTQKSIEKEARKGPKKKKIVKSKRARRQATKDLKMQALREHNQDLAGQDSDSDTESVGLGRS